MVGTPEPRRTEIRLNRTAGNDWGEYQLLATVASDPVTPDATVKPFACTPADDNKWDIRTPGNYEIAVDMQARRPRAGDSITVNRRSFRKTATAITPGLDT